MRQLYLQLVPVIIIMLLVLAISSKKKSSMKTAQRLTFVVILCTVAFGIYAIEKLNILSVSAYSSINIILYLSDLSFCAVMVLIQAMDRQKDDGRGFLIFLNIVFHCCMLLTYAFETLYQGFYNQSVSPALIVFINDMIDIILYCIQVLVIWFVLSLENNQYKKLQIFLRILIVAYAAFCVAKIWNPAFDTASWFIWWIMCLALVFIIVRESPDAFTIAILIGYASLGSIFEMTSYFYDRFLIAPLGDLCGIIMLFEGMYIGRSNTLSETERELDFAASLQLSMLPKDYSIPNFDNIDLYASMRPAKEVGGDFYDFYKLSDKHLAFVIADVSGKGTPGAMMMMKAITAIKNFAMAGMPVDKLMAYASDNINEHNDAMLFVTAWMGILNVETGKLNFVNAGHNPPIIRHADRSTEELITKPDFIMGFFPNAKYEKHRVMLKPGDTIFLYTDGITEDYNTDNEQYGMARLHMVLGNNYKDSKELCQSVIADVDKFAGEADQFDDMTMMAVSFKYERPGSEAPGAAPISFEELPADSVEACDIGQDVSPLEIEVIRPETELDEKLLIDIIPEIEGDRLQDIISKISDKEIIDEEIIETTALSSRVYELTDKIDAYLTSFGCSSEIQNLIDICFDEVFSNVANYAYDGDEGPCRIELGRLTEPKGFRLVLADSGMPYNPLAKADPNADRSLEERSFGGMGIYMVKNYMDDVRYEYKNNENRLTIVKLFDE